jgi:uncharacterized DUF497 family protein
VKITYDAAKRAATLVERGLDFSDAGKLFEGVHFTGEDVRHDYGEKRFITAGMLFERVVVVVWTFRGGDRRIISMRFANERERKRFQASLPGS